VSINGIMAIFTVGAEKLPDGRYQAHTVGFRIPFKDEFRLGLVRRSVTKSGGPTLEGGYCQSCGKTLGKVTKRRKFCDDTCRQAGHRKSVAGTKPRKPTSPIPDPVENHFNQIIAALNSGMVEVWHHRHGRGVLNVLDPYWDALSDVRRDSKFRIMRFDKARCRFRETRWIDLPWNEVHILAHHENRPKHLGWFPTRNWHRRGGVRKNRVRHIHMDAFESPDKILDFADRDGGEWQKFFRGTRKRKVQISIPFVKGINHAGEKIERE
jgi:hypothetical protein